MGRPMASTEPKATTRITTAKARPRVSEEGSSNSPKALPPSSTWRPACVGSDVLEDAADRRRRPPSRRPGSRATRRRSCRPRCPSVAICGSGAGAYGLTRRMPSQGVEVGRREVVALLVAEPGERGSVATSTSPGRRRWRGELANSCSIARLDRGVVDALLGLGTRSVPGMPPPKPPKCVLERVEAAGALEARGVKSWPKLPPTALETPPTTTTASDPAEDDGLAAPEAPRTETSEHSDLRGVRWHVGMPGTVTPMGCSNLRRPGRRNQG